MTKILKIGKQKPEAWKIKEAAALLKQGELVAFPTETVYGLGADALNAEAVKKIFLAKGRPSDNPLIVHIASLEHLSMLVKEIPPVVKTLAQAFWPGPLTIILPKASTVPQEVTANLPTVAVRMPNHPIALALIKEAGPIAAPSANLSTRPSPTSADHVKEDFFGKIPLIIDGGHCIIGLESTVLDLTATPALILRPGAITKEMLEKYLPVKFYQQKSEKPRSPGMKYRHYAPKAPLFILEGPQEKVKAYIEQQCKENPQEKIAILTTSTTTYKAPLIIHLGTTKEAIAKHLFAALRKCDQEQATVIYAESIDEQGLGKAIRNRLQKAGKIIKIK